MSNLSDEMYLQKYLKYKEKYYKLKAAQSKALKQQLGGNKCDLCKTCKNCTHQTNSNKS